jgi:hypothetical protein
VSSGRYVIWSFKAILSIFNAYEFLIIYRSRSHSSHSYYRRGEINSVKARSEDSQSSHMEAQRRNYQENDESGPHGKFLFLF